MITANRRRRGPQVIDPKFQYKVIARVGGISLFYFTFCVATAILLPSVMSWIGISKTGAGDELGFRVEVLLKVLLIPLLVSFAGMCVHGLQETFRVAGPAYRLKSVFAKVDNLTIPRGVIIRRDDHLQEATAAANDALIRVHDHLVEAQKLGLELRQSVSNDAAPDPQEWAGVQRQVDALVANLSEFDLSGVCEPAPSQEEPAPRAATPSEPVSVP